MSRVVAPVGRSARCKAILCSHDPTVNQGLPLDLSPWIIQASVQKHIRSEGQWSLVLVPAETHSGGWLDVLRPNDLVSLYLDDGASGAVRVMMGYVDSIERSVEVMPTGAVRTRYLVFGTDFAKALRLTNLYFNPWASEVLAHQVGGPGLTDNLAGAEMLRQGLQWFGTPADVIESTLLVVLGYQGQWRLPESYPTVPPARSGNVLTGAPDARGDLERLRQILERRVPGVPRVSRDLARLADQGLVEPEGPGNPAAFGFQHPLQNGAGLTRSRSSYFLAERPGRGRHLGVDVVAAPGTPVHPIGPGTIEHLRFRRSTEAKPTAAGNFIVVRHEVGGIVFRSKYMHLQDWHVGGHDLDAPSGPDLALLNRHPGEGAEDADQADFTVAGRPWRVGDRVSPADVIALSGETGNAAGHPHLHLEQVYLRRDADGKAREVFLDPQRFIPAIGGGPAAATPDRSGTTAAQLLDQVRAHRTGKPPFRTLLDLLDRSYIEREHVDGFTASEQMLSESGDLLTLLQSRSNDCMNELFFDLRIEGRDPGQPAPMVADELGGNVDEAGVVTAPAYRPAVVLREYPFTTIARETYPSSAPVTGSGPVASAPGGGTVSGPQTVSAGLSGPVYGLPDPPGVFFSSRTHPVRVQPVRPVRSAVPRDPQQPATEAEPARAEPPSFRFIDTAVLPLGRILRMQVGRSDHDTFNVFDLRSSDLEADLRFVNRGVLPLLSYESMGRHGLRVREITSTFTQMGLAASDASLRKTLARWAILNDHWHQHASQYLAGTIDCLPLLDCRVGYRLDIPELDECYYVEGVRHDFALDPEGRASLRTSLTVTRGQPLVRRPGDAIRHVSIPGAHPGDTGSVDSDGITPRVGDAVVPGTANTVYEVASAVSARKSPVAPVSPSDRRLRRTIGTRYFPVLAPRGGLRTP